MDGFKQQKKVACFKEGGQVGYKSRRTHSETKEESSDVAQDKKIIKKAFTIHDEQKHEGKTDLSKLCNGGRAKTNGSVKRYKAGGAIGMKKTSADIDNIKKIKQTKVAKADAPSKAAGLASLTEEAPMFCKGGKAKK